MRRWGAADGARSAATRERIDVGRGAVDSAGCEVKNGEASGEATGEASGEGAVHADEVGEAVMGTDAPTSGCGEKSLPDGADAAMTARGGAAGCCPGGGTEDSTAWGRSGEGVGQSKAGRNRTRGGAPPLAPSPSPLAPRVAKMALLRAGLCRMPRLLRLRARPFPRREQLPRPTTAARRWEGVSMLRITRCGETPSWAARERERCARAPSCEGEGDVSGDEPPPASTRAQAARVARESRGELQSVGTAGDAGGSVAGEGRGVCGVGKPGEARDGRGVRGELASSTAGS